jgi:hypothetical protein
MCQNLGESVPQKAAILLRLALTGEVSQERLEELYSVY